MRFQGLLGGQLRPRDGTELTHGERAGTGLLRLFLAFLLVNGLLLAPVWIFYGGVGPLWVSLEAGALVGAVALLPARPWARWVAAAVALLVVAMTIVGLGDTAMRLSLSRPLNLYVDIWLLRSVWHLAVGAVGAPMATLAFILVPVALAGVAALLAWTLTPADRSRSVLGTRLTALGLFLFVAAAILVERVPSLEYHVDAPAARTLAEQARIFVRTLGERERFAAALERIPDSYADLPGLLARLEGRDVVLGFIESYGTTALEDPRYRGVVGARLDDFERRMEEGGLHLVTGRLVSPTQGGQSWLAHGSMLSGIWLDNQIRYDMMLGSGRETLVDDFQRAGHRVVAVMPAIVLPWPEGERFGYDETLVRKDIDYAGPPLNWVEMPDQFTWSFLERAVLEKHEGPVFAEVGLISSHAPWTPILDVIDDWDEVGDGSVFRRWENAGEAPEQLWLDTDRVREHYAMSIEYAVHAMASYAERYVDENTLLIVLGDHQPAPLITGDGAPWTVPVHVVSRDPDLVAPFLDWGFIDGAWPDPEQEPLGMDYFRDWFVHAYSSK